MSPLSLCSHEDSVAATRANRRFADLERASADLGLVRPGSLVERYMPYRRRGHRPPRVQAAVRARIDREPPLLLFGILVMFTGVQLITLGLLAELQART